MGFRKNWDIGDIANAIRSISREANSSYNDGFTQWGCKQDLYLIKEVLDRELEKSPNFGEMEDEWLKDLEQKRIIKILKS
jgi:hypothetical protein